MENLQSLPQEILGEILSFLQLKDVCNLASASARWNALAWSKITHIDIPDILQQPLAILRKCSAKSINSLALDLADDKVANMEDYIACLNDFKKLTGLQTSAPASENGQLYDAIYQLTQLKRLELVDNNRNFVEFDLFQRLTRMKNLTELGITVEMSLDSLPIEELTHLKTLKFPFSDLVDDSLLERALTLTGLEFLDLTWCQKITHNSFSKIVAMTNLTKLDVSRCLDILARSFELLKDLPRLWCLDLSYHHTLSSKEMKVICELPHVTCLHLVSNNGLESEANQYIARMTNLQELHLEGRSRSLSLLTGLTNLRILATGVLEDRPCIATLTNLVQLSIFDTSDSDLQWLSSMTWLSRLHIGGSKFSADSATQLTSLLPNCLITLPSKLK